MDERQSMSSTRPSIQNTCSTESNEDLPRDVLDSDFDLDLDSFNFDLGDLDEDESVKRLTESLQQTALEPTTKPIEKSTKVAPADTSDEQTIPVLEKSTEKLELKRSITDEILLEVVQSFLLSDYNNREYLLDDEHWILRLQQKFNFSTEITESLKRFLSDLQISHKSASLLAPSNDNKRLHKLYMSKEQLQSIKSDKDLTDKIRFAFVWTLVRHVILQDHELQLSHSDELLRTYSSHSRDKKAFEEMFDKIDTRERYWLLQYERAMKCVLRVLPGKSNKTLCMTIAAFLEDSSHGAYVTGGDPSYATIRREAIFEALAGYEKVTKSSRLSDSSINNSPNKGVVNKNENKKEVLRTEEGEKPQKDKSEVQK